MATRTSHLFQKRPGQWISPSEFALISRRLNPASLGLRITVISDTLVSTRRIVGDGDEDWTPTLLLIPLRAGLDTLQREFMPAFVSFFDWPWCVGAVGGKPGSAYYYVGIEHDRNRILYLDPHTTKTRLDMARQDAENTCRTDKLKSMDLSKSCSSICIGLYFSHLDDFVGFVQRYKQEQLSGAWRAPLFEVVNDADLSITEEPLIDETSFVAPSSRDRDAGTKEAKGATRRVATHQAPSRPHPPHSTDSCSASSSSASSSSSSVPHSQQQQRRGSRNTQEQHRQQQQQQQQQQEDEREGEEEGEQEAIAPLQVRGSSRNSRHVQLDGTRRATVATSTLTRRLAQSREITQEDDDEDGFVVVDFAPNRA